MAEAEGVKPSLIVLKAIVLSLNYTSILSLPNINVEASAAARFTDPIAILSFMPKVRFVEDLTAPFNFLLFSFLRTKSFNQINKLSLKSLNYSEPEPIQTSFYFYKTQ